jgi:1-acyl-sn-glycerol-3-phosphate acyltransferase
VPDDDGSWSDFLGPRSAVLDGLRVVRRVALILAWTLPLMPVQVVLRLLPGRLDTRLARRFWRGMCAIMSLRVRVVGTPAQHGADGRPVVYVATHISWLDILALGSRLDASFIAKEEISRWPVVNWIGWMGRTVYVRRARSSTARERDEMRARLAAGDNLILFPEGTTSDGARVLPFRSAFLSIAEVPVTADGRPAIVQPVSLAYDRLAGLPTGRGSRTVFAWFGDQDLASHFNRIGRERGLRVTLLFHEPVDPGRYGSRKALTEALWQVAAAGAATLRQNREARPLPAP